LEVLNLIELGELICVGARERRESRGWHVRTDFPYKNPLMDKKLIIKRVNGKSRTEWR
jgi:aspartate oxidase